MTFRELSQLSHLKREIAMDRQRLQHLESQALPGAQVMTGMPHAPGAKDKLGDLAAEIADLKQLIEAKIERCLAEQRRLEAYVLSIDDSFIRQIIIYRFVDELTWHQIAGKVGGKNTADGLRMTLKRFLQKN